VGLSEKRIHLGYCTAAEGQKFQIEATKFNQLIQELGPSPLRPKSDNKKKAKT